MIFAIGILMFISGGYFFVKLSAERLNTYCANYYGLKKGDWIYCRNSPNQEFIHQLQFGVPPVFKYEGIAKMPFGFLVRFVNLSETPMMDETRPLMRMPVNDCLKLEDEVIADLIARRISGQYGKNGNYVKNNYAMEVFRKGLMVKNGGLP